MRALVTGAGGQLGVELLRTVPGNFAVVGLKHSELDISDPQAVNAAIDAHRPEIVVNAAAYNAVDDAEKNVDAAYRANAAGPANLAAAAQRVGARIIHISTDYVFDGKSTKPYRPTDPTNPINTYGKSKLAGEQEVSRSSSDHLIIRSSWLFSAHGRSFLQIILRAMKEGKPVRAVKDQASVPTACRGLAEVIWTCAPRGGPQGIAHWVDQGMATRYDQAVAIRLMALERGLVRGVEEIKSALTAYFNPPASRPRFSVMDASELVTATGMKQRHWKDGLWEVLEEICLQQPVAPGRRD